MIRIPLITASLCLISGALHLLPEVQRESLYFDRAQLVAGNMLGLVSGHWLHGDPGHLGWNVAALAILGTALEIDSRRLLLAAILGGSIAVDLLLLSPMSELQRYCGLSGVLNTLLGVYLLTRWRDTGSPLVALIAVLCAAKIAVEIKLQQGLFSNTSWPPFAPAHLVGILAAPLIFFAHSAFLAPGHNNRK